MLFNSVQFAAFFVTFILVYWAIPHRARLWLLMAGGYFFYGCWDWRFTGLLLFSTLLDFSAGVLIGAASSQTAKRVYLATTIVINLTLLGIFKYFNFFSHSLHELLTTLGVAHSEWELKIILPVGISFYTFQSMSYAIDVFRGKAKPERNLLDYAVFVSFFPQLVAGPIERAAHLLPQVKREKQFVTAEFLAGLELMAWGFFKKMVIADNVCKIADHVFNTPAADQSGVEVLLGLYAFAVQIYCDFSGYSDIARGAARCLGFELMVNFRVPYLATNPQEFWRRWHISLSTWLRDYLYISLGGSRGGTFATYRNLILTMTIGGLWHGAAWTYVFWGLYQGIILVVHRLIVGKVGEARPVSSLRDVIVYVVKLVFFFQIICIGWLFFRAQSMGQVWEMFLRIVMDFRVTPLSLWYFRYILFFAWFAMLADVVWFVRERRRGELDDMPRLGYSLTARAALALVAVSAVIVFGEFDAQTFIYFQF